MSSVLRVRKLDASTALLASDPGSVPEMNDIESVLSRAFAGDLPKAGQNPTETQTIHSNAFRRSTVIAGLLDGEIYVAETSDADRKIVGCAVWFGPGHSLFDSEDQQKYAVGPLMATLDEKLRNWWLTFEPQFNTFLTSALGGGTKNAWHLQTLAVDPQYQRKGIASLLMNTVIEKARLTGTRLCLETQNEANIPIYERLGFDLMPKAKGGRDESKGTFTAADGGSLSMWVMARDFN
ncbi:acyl-CoA N-acyltransferase [Mycena epipterygia]|nr:acyl-CoA N-acyltransferase [Mycena epipterygia]